MWLKALIIIPLIFCQYAAATCGVCQTLSKTACRSENSFSACSSGVPLNDILNCPTNYFCTDGEYTCYENAEPVCKADKAPTTTTTMMPWTADCEQATKSGFQKNENDPTCTSFLHCKVAEDGTLESASILKCKPNQYFDVSLNTCTATKPDGCTAVSTEPTTTTQKPWSAEETCLDVTKSASFKNEDDPTCATYLYCYVSNGVATALIYTCKETKPYFDSTLKGCSAKKPADCA
ncbi:uncharacterized protein LOC117579083 [Drosophila guanche]|uniref:uncharacterized protein LOC117579083 n=1 Tax=Drosophila guanche TaxID=7266 RepID=UPI001470B5B7|nr:uncharacterized protein LOC117579083 [Drosophila guanche]